MILATIQKIIALSPLNASWWQEMANGAMLAFFIVLQSVVLMRKNRHFKKEKESAEDTAKEGLTHNTPNSNDNDTGRKP